MSSPRVAPAPEVIWHDVECGAYAADLPLWRELAREAAGPVLELGCGTGRVALDLAAAGFEVTALDQEAVLLDALRRRAAERGLAVEVQLGDVRRFALGRDFSLILAPMQLVHLLGGVTGRREALRRVSSHLRDGGRVAISLLDAAATTGAVADRDLAGAVPDVCEVAGWIYSSLPVDVRLREGTIEVRRLRQTVEPAGGLTDELSVTTLDPLTVAELEREARDAGLQMIESIAIEPTSDHVGSTVAVLEETS